MELSTFLWVYGSAIIGATILAIIIGWKGNL